MSQFVDDIEFRKLVAGRADVDLVQLMLELAGDAYPDLDRMDCLIELDRIAVACDLRQSIFARPAPIRERLEAISRQLYDVEGFHGNREAYYDPANSYLNEVLARRCGIPISLGVVYIAVARRAGVKMFGVNTPGHFVVGCMSEGEVLYVDPFNGGDVLDYCECRRRVERVLGQPDVLTSANFQPACPLEIGVRVLRNLKAAYAMESNWSAALPVQRRLATLLPRCAAEQRDLGLLYLRTGQPYRALNLLEGYMATCGSEQAAAVQTSVRTARKMVAELN
jgi:regulator of sirC expression with transglutaminase-like and TPR domain